MRKNKFYSQNRLSRLLSLAIVMIVWFCPIRKVLAGDGIMGYFKKQMMRQELTISATNIQMLTQGDIPIEVSLLLGEPFREFQVVNGRDSLSVYQYSYLLYYNETNNTDAQGRTTTKITYSHTPFICIFYGGKLWKWGTLDELELEKDPTFQQVGDVLSQAVSQNAIGHSGGSNNWKLIIGCLGATCIIPVVLAMFVSI